MHHVDNTENVDTILVKVLPDGSSIHDSGAFYNDENYGNDENHEDDENYENDENYEEDEIMRMTNYFSKYSRIDPQHSSPASQSIVKLSNVVSSLMMIMMIMMIMMVMMMMMVMTLLHCSVVWSLS